MYEDLILKIKDFPDKLARISTLIDGSMLDTPIRSGAWSVRQSINHLVDSHVNSFIRIKSALSEDKPTVRPYNEEVWAEMVDTNKMDLSSTIQIIKGLHARMTYILENIQETDWDRLLIHPEVGEMKFHEYVKVTADHGYGHLNSVIKALNLE